jgi:hypothetical protein
MVKRKRGEFACQLETVGFGGVEWEVVGNWGLEVSNSVQVRQEEISPFYVDWTCVSPLLWYYYLLLVLLLVLPLQFLVEQVVEQRRRVVAIY